MTFDGEEGQRERRIRFPDGSTIVMRPLEVRDGRHLAGFVTQLSPESEYRRFLSAGGGVRSQWVASLINADQVDALVFGAFAENEFGSSLVAIAESIRLSGDEERAEFAMAAIDPWQHMGIGTLLAGHLAGVARFSGVRFWESYMLADNRQIGPVLARVGRRVDLVVHSGMSATVHELGVEAGVGRV